MPAARGEDQTSAGEPPAGADVGLASARCRRIRCRRHISSSSFIGVTIIISLLTSCPRRAARASSWQSRRLRWPRRGLATPPPPPLSSAVIAQYRHRHTQPSTEELPAARGEDKRLEGGAPVDAAAFLGEDLRRRRRRPPVHHWRPSPPSPTRR